MLIVLSLGALFFGLVQANDGSPRVKTPLGDVRGFFKTSERGRVYEAYEGIPYAQPPIASHRFEPPKPISAWLGELGATKKSHDCLQYDHDPDFVTSEHVKGSEDCLYLNIYAPLRQKGETAELRPVLFWIHGGAFMHGSGNLFGAKYLADSGVVLVTVNYRLGPLGFLSTEDKVVPGNMGLKDQSLALRWVHDNIEWFGGDPERITLVGLSAGGVSVHYHYLSALSRGLFRNGLSISGTVLDCWAQTENAAEKARKLGALMGCPTVNNKEMIECLKSRSARTIVQSVKSFMPWLYNPFTPFGPVVEKGGDKPFISRPPIEILESGDFLDAPWITSVTSDEGLYPVAEFATNDRLLKELDANWTSIAPHLLDFNYTVPLRLHEEVAMKIRGHYLGNKPINRENARSVTKMVGDRLFVVDAEKAARMQAKANKSPVWFYYYSYRAAQSLSNALSGTEQDLGVCHADDAYLVIENHRVVPTTTESDRAMQADLTRLWVSFAENGTQAFSPSWSKVGPLDKKFKYLHISEPSEFNMDGDKNFGDKYFWNSINFDENVLKTSSSKNEL